LKVIPGNLDLLISASWKLIQLKKINEAEPLLLKALELGSIDAVNMNLGHIYLIKDEQDKALEFYKNGSKIAVQKMISGRALMKILKQ